MTLRVTRWLLVLGLGCAYYNGLYNADRLAGEAARARREGRPGDARALWEQAAVKAESVAARFKKSRYRDDALLLQGRALREADQCNRALRPLTVVAESGGSPADRSRALLLLGECHVSLGEAEAARRLLAPLLEDRDAGLVRRARIWRARASLSLGDYAAALGDLEGVSDTAAGFDRALALAGAGRPEEAARVLAAVMAAAYDEGRWAGALEALGASAPGAAAALVDGLVVDRRLSPGQRGRLLLADAERWRRASREDRARARYAGVAGQVADSAEGRMARAQLLLAELRESRDLGRLPEIWAALDAIVADGGPAAAVAEPARRVLAGLGEDEGGGLSPDLRLFVVAEELRDSLGARGLAAELFLRLGREHPGSPIAPKALLAGASLLPDAADSLLTIVDREYAASPYRLAAHGLEAPRFAVVEDSLRTLLRAAQVGELSPGPGPEGRQGADDDEIRRPRRPGADRRPPEP